jgi:probable F420-dependent oxidoreductase
LVEIGVDNTEPVTVRIGGAVARPSNAAPSIGGVVQFGLTLPNFQYGAPATREHLLDVAQVAEECGYTSMWTSDHILVGADFPRYGTIFECLTTLAWLAAKTEHIRVGTSILIAPLRNAILSAKQVATIDNLTGGRFVLGVGLGWNEGEFHFLGADWKRRAQIMDESLQVIRNLWTSERPTFAGDFYRYENTLFFPKPAQPGGPPIWVGGGSPAALKRAARFGDSWHGDEVMPDDFAAATRTLQTLAVAAGRAVTGSVRFTVDLFHATGQTRAQAALTGYYKGDDKQVGMKGSFDGMRTFVGQYKAMHATDFICQFEHDTQPQHIAFIRQFAQEVIKRV